MNIFPRKILAVDISDSSIEIMQMSHFLGKAKVTFLSRSEMEKGIVEKGKIIERKKLVLKIKEYCGPSKKNSVVLALPDGIVSSHIFRFAGDKKISGEEILAEAKRSLSMNVEDVYWDFAVQDADGEKIVFFAFANKKDVDVYKNIFKEINFIPKIFDLNSLCVLRALDPNHETVLVVDLGGRSGMMSIFDKGALQSIDAIDFGGEDITEKISEKMQISHEQAEMLKMNDGFDVDKEDGKFFLVLQEVLQPLIEEMRRVINAYEEDGRGKIKKIILSGGSGLIPKLDEYMYENFGINCEVGRPQMADLISDYLESNKVKSSIDTIFFAATLGLAAEYLGMKSRFDIGINLLK